AAFAPEFRRLDGRHQHLDSAGAVLLLAHDAADLLEDAQAERQEGIDAGRLLADHAGAQHQAMRDDLRLFGRFAQDRQEEWGQTHGRWSIRLAVDETRPRETGSPRKTQGHRGRKSRSTPPADQRLDVELASASLSRFARLARISAPRFAADRPRNR